MQLYIGNKNYSSWSMRPWVLLRHFGIAFDEVKLRFDSFEPGSQFKQRIAAVSPAGRVPVLVDDGFAIWDSLAIAEYVAERFPALWPSDARHRARARCLSAEMHGGFGALREHCPMNIEASLAQVGARVLAERPAVRADLGRIVSMWSGQLDASSGPWLFGDFCIADAMYAPVCCRIVTYALPVPAEIDAYIARVTRTPAVAEWIADARAERDFLAFEEPYRSAPR